MGRLADLLRPRTRPPAPVQASPRRWEDVVDQRPWFDRPDAERHLARLYREGAVSAEEAELLERWRRDGYVIVEDCVEHEAIDRLANVVDEIWFRPDPLPGLLVSDVVLDGVTHVHVAHEDLLRLPSDVRERARSASNWRVGELHLHDGHAATVVNSPCLARLCSLLLGRPAVPEHSLAFSKGSRQQLHQDTAVFHVHPRNFLCGVWIACEDISPASGPLEFHPGSHREPLFEEFTNYPQTQRRTAPPDRCDRYDAHVRELATRYPRLTFTPKMGAALFWHGMLVHGGAPVEDESLTRKSFVVHFIAEGTNKEREVEGPFNW